MVSTYIDYNLLTRDMKTSLQRTAQQTLVARETEYYKANIGNVTSIDEFLGDYRLYAYAMKAHGLEDMTYAKAFMRKVLESDLSDDNSYANMLTDDRYQNFARAFSFSQSTEVVQSDAQEDALIGLYNQSVSNIDTKMVQETRYYDTMMDTITNVDQLLQNDRLRSYTFQVFGVDAKYFNYAQVRGALTSDLNDPNSYFNTNFAPALDAAIATKASSDQALSALSSRVQSQTRITNIDALLARPDTSDEDKVTLQAEKTTLQNNIATINAAFPEMTSNIDAYAGVEAEIRDLRTQMNQPDVTEAEKAAFQAEIDERQTALKTMKGVNFYATDLQTKQQESTATIARIAVFKDLALMYDFAADGSVPSGGTAQAADSRKATQEVYAYKAPRATNSVAVLHKAYYEETIANVTTVAQIKGDSRLYSYILTAFGLPSSTTVTMLESILTSDPNDPASYVNTKGGEYNAAYKTLRAAFNFQTDGTLAAGDKPQTAAQIKTTSDNYMVRYNDADEAADATLINSFKSLMKIVSNVDDLIADTKIMKLALTAVGLENESDTARKIRRVLTSDLTDPKSYVYTLKDDRYLQLAKAFNFNADGSAGVPMLAQAESEILNTAKSYVIEKSRFATEDVKTKATEEAKYYSAEISKVKSLDELLSNRRLVDFVLVSAGLDPEKVSTDHVRKMFQSDFSDPDSFINKEPDTTIYKELVASYNFDSKGELARPELGIQTKRGLLETEDLYLNQTLEQQRGEDNAGVRLALYFRRQASGINTAYDLLADSALLQVIQTTFSIPEAMSSADVDVQYAYINRLLDVKDLQDPDKLEKLLLRFTALYDVENNVDISAAQLILSGGGGGGISADTLFSLSQLRLGGF
ncbi:DUF1217 domain-containing protein [Rhizobium sp. Root483D2]|uniref:DUF1217 domain-containing protein n=1 Tax=Rhizobium sp. Root483D2 TaxID=1736545 RepID=UPI00071239B4|nr:DUF1217 domain-containing protein [Rhizobium sp. Root483D2]KQY48416.1 hypothetical protein ASD32_10005 [Rhizobium sp. Root483D2]